MSAVLHFLQHKLDNESLLSTLKVYVAAFASFNSPVDGQSIRRHVLGIRILRGAKRLHSLRPPLVLPWDLAVVLKALSLPPTSIAIKKLSLKTALHLALASAKRIGDLHAFSVDP